MHKQNSATTGLLCFVGAAAFVFVCGCYSVSQPTPPHNWTVLCAEQIPNLGDALLASGLFVKDDGIVLLKVGGMLDKTRFTVDTGLLMRKMRTHLVNRGGGRIAAFDNDADVDEFCKARRAKVLRGAMKGELKYLAGRIVRASEFKQNRIRISMENDFSPQDATTDVGGLLSLLRDEIVLQGNGRFVFLEQGSVTKADFRMRGGFTGISGDRNLRVVFEKTSNPGEPCFEASMPMRKELLDASIDAAYVLSGELNVMTRETQGYTDDYVRMGFNLTDPNTALHKWEGACEISVTEHKSILYQ